MKIHMGLTLAALCLAMPSVAQADQLTNTLNALNRSVAPGSARRSPNLNENLLRTQQLLEQRQSVQSYVPQTGAGAMGGLFQNSLAGQLPAQSGVSASQVGGYASAIGAGRVPDIQGQTRSLTNQYLPKGVTVDPYQLLQTK